MDDIDCKVFYSCLNPEATLKPDENFLK